MTSFSINGSTLAIELNNPNQLTVDTSLIKVIAQDKPCLINSGSTFSSLTCTLEANSDGSAKLVTGNFLPYVYISPLGFANFNQDVNPLFIPLVATSLVEI